MPEDAFMARFKFGDEFIIIIDADLNTALEKINDIQENCKKNTFSDPENQRTFNVQFSFGAACFEDHTDTQDTLLVRAEKELKESKNKLY